jgi:glyceraldehyde-3-phosphate dehydrogenase/erythrose-4-phosphate dehydrogenase
VETPDLNLVAANDIGTSDNVEYLLKYDTVYGRYEKPVEATDDGHLKIGDHRLRLLREKDPGRLPWKSLSVDIVFECTGALPNEWTSLLTSVLVPGTSFCRRHRRATEWKRSFMA